MRKLSEPNVIEANKLLDDAISRKKDQDYVNSLNTNKLYIRSRNGIFQRNKSKLENVGASVICTEADKEAIHSCFTSSFKKHIKENELKGVYEECRGVCPFCGEGRLEEVDHYIPKEYYPEFTLYPMNLIPICNKCNKKKSDKFLDGSNERRFIYFYSDYIDDLKFLQVSITFDSTIISKTTKIKYTADFSKINDVYLRKIIEQHYKELDLLKRYAEAAGNELSHIEDIYLHQEDYDKEKVRDSVNRTVIGERNAQLKKAGQNDWKYLLYEELLAVGYIDKLVDYVCCRRE